LRNARRQPLEQNRWGNQAEPTANTTSQPGRAHHRGEKSSDFDAGRWPSHISGSG
jgi:hypothetical protein